jgi:hypothetical protein
MNEEMLKLNLEQGLLSEAIRSNTFENDENKKSFTHYDEEIKKLEYIRNKELEINQSTKKDGTFYQKKHEELINDVKELIWIYKKVAGVDIEKTKDGYLKIAFFKSAIQKFAEDNEYKYSFLKGTGAYLLLEVKDGMFKIIQICPEIRYSNYEDNLKQTHNLTLFLMKIACDFEKLLFPLQYS